MFDITGVLAYPPLKQAPAKAGGTPQMGHKRVKEANEDYRLLYSNTQEEFRWAHELAWLGFSQENSVRNSPCLAISTTSYLTTLSQTQSISS